jgi:hypothetical protein
MKQITSVGTTLKLRRGKRDRGSSNPTFTVIANERSECGYPVNTLIYMAFLEIRLDHLKIKFGIRLAISQAPS